MICSRSVRQSSPSQSGIRSWRLCCPSEGGGGASAPFQATSARTSNGIADLGHQQNCSGRLLWRPRPWIATRARASGHAPSEVGRPCRGAAGSQQQLSAALPSRPARPWTAPLPAAEQASRLRPICDAVSAVPLQHHWRDWVRLVRIPHRLHELRRCPLGHLSLDASAADGEPCLLEQRPPLSRSSPAQSPEGLVVAAGRGGAAGNQPHVRPEGPEEGHRGTAPAAGGPEGLSDAAVDHPQPKTSGNQRSAPAIEELPSENPGLTGERCGIRIPVTQRVALLLSSGSGDDQGLTGGQDGARHHRAPRLARAVPPSP